MGAGWYPPDHPKHVRGLAFNGHADRNLRATKNAGGSWFAVAHNTTSGHSQNPDGRRTDVGNGVRFMSRDCGIEGVKQRGSGREWFAGEGKDLEGHLVAFLRPQSRQCADCEDPARAGAAYCAGMVSRRTDVHVIDYDAFAPPHLRKGLPLHVTRRHRKAEDRAAERRCYEAVDRRDGKRCQVPGCRQCLQEHNHIVPRSTATKAIKHTTANVIGMCRTHHQWITDGLLSVEGNANRRLTWTITTIGLRYGYRLPTKATRAVCQR